jgi:mannose-6-phosphate isomerase-like protein (cupin superfamily)
MGAVREVRVVGIDDVAPIDLGAGSWSRMIVTETTAPGTVSSLGYSVFTPGTHLGSVRHETDEVAYVVAGAGHLELDDGEVPFRTGDALQIPAGVWHAVVNPGDVDVVMVFGFPHPDYPPTDRR